MATLQWTWYRGILQRLGDKEVDFGADTLKAILLADTYTPNYTTDAVLADITAGQLATMFGYTSGGQTLSGVTWAGGVLDCDDFSWTASGGTIGPFLQVVIIDTTVAGSPLVCGGAVAAAAVSYTTGRTFTIQNSASGIITL